MTQEAKLEFPNVVDAVRKRDGSLWEIGDALIKECGMPLKSGIHDGSRERIKRAAKELTDLKIEGYGINTLVKIRNVAAKMLEKIPEWESALTRIRIKLDRATEIITARIGTVNPDLLGSLAEKLQEIETDAHELARGELSNFGSLAEQLQEIETDTHELLFKVRNALPKNTTNVSHLRVVNE